MRLPPFRLERYFARYEFSAPYILCASDCESTSVDELLSLEPGARERLLGQRLGYTESTGAPALRSETSRLYSSIAPDEILVHPGAEEAIFLFMHAALGPGDHLIVHSPCYQSLQEIARSIGCEVTPWAAREENRWALDADELRGLLRGNTRAIVVNTPHNPTGFLMADGPFRDLARMADSRGITLFSDEVYRGLERSPSDRLPPACDLSPSAVSLGVLSKTYGLAGLRIGWVATHDEALRRRMAQLKDYTTICSSGPSELLAEVALRHGEHLAARNRGIIAENQALLEGFFSRHGEMFSWQPPVAGPIAFPRLLRGKVDVFCDELVRERGVLLLPGSVYGDEGNHFRIGFGRKGMADALSRLESFVASRKRSQEVSA
jgi:aspartate/methionine/tyrosine aminotransferase